MRAIGRVDQGVTEILNKQQDSLRQLREFEQVRARGKGPARAFVSGIGASVNGNQVDWGSFRVVSRSLCTEFSLAVCRSYEKHSTCMQSNY